MRGQTTAVVDKGGGWPPQGERRIYNGIERISSRARRLLKQNSLYLEQLLVTVMPQVFISYARADQKVLVDLGRCLKQDSIEVWVDKEGIFLGEEFWEVIQDAILQADVVLFLASDTSVDSPSCLRELRYAQEHNKRIIPIMLPGADERILPSLIQHRQCLSLQGGQEFEKVLAELSENIQTSPIDLRMHTALLVRAKNWSEGETNHLHGKELEKAEAWLTRCSHGAVQPTHLQRRFIQSSRADAGWRRRLKVAIILLLAILTTATVLVVVLWRQADGARRINLALKLALRAQAAKEPVQATLLAAESLRRHPNLDADQVLRRTFSLIPGRGERHDLGLSIHLSSLDAFGHRAAFVNSDREMRVYDVRQAREIFQQIFDQEIGALKISSDGKKVACGLQSGLLIVYSVDSNEALWNKNLGFPIKHVLISTDMSRLAVFAEDERRGRTRVYIISLDSQETLLRGLLRNPRSPALDWNGTRLAYATSLNVVRVIEIEAWRRVLNYQADSSVHDLVFRPDSNHLVVSVGYDAAEDPFFEGEDSFGQILTLDLSTQKMLEEISTEIPAHSIVFSSDGFRLVSSTRSRISIWNLTAESSGKATTRFEAGSSVKSVALDEENDRLTIVGESSIGIVPSTGQEYWKRMQLERTISMMEAAGDDSLFVAVDDSRVLKVSLRDGTAQAELSIENPLDLKASEGGRWLVIEVEKGYRLWDSESQEPHGLLNELYEAIDISTRGHLAAVGQTGKILIWDLSRMEQVAQLPAAEQIDTLEFSRDDRLLGVGSAGNKVQVWELSSQRVLMSTESEDPVNAFKFGPEGKLLYIGVGYSTGDLVFDKETRGEVLVYEASTGMELDRLGCDDKGAYDGVGSGSVHCIGMTTRLQIAPSGEWLLASNRYMKAQATGVEGIVHVWNLQDWKKTLRIEHQKSIKGSAWSPDWRWVATFDKETVRIWDLVESEEKARVWASGVTGVSFSGRENRSLVTSHEDGSIILWPWRAEDMKEIACSRVQVNLSRAQWSRHLPSVPYSETCPGWPIPEEQEIFERNFRQIGMEHLPGTLGIPGEPRPQYLETTTSADRPLRLR